MASFIQGAVGDSIARLQNDIKSIPRSLSSGLQGVVQNATNQATGAVRGAVNNAINTGMNAAMQAAIQGIKGNGTAAVETLLSAPQSILNNAISGLFGESASSISLSGPLQVPGASSTASSANGVAPNDGLKGIQARSDPLLSFCWYCEMPQVPSFNINSAALESQTSSLITDTALQLGSSLPGAFGLDTLSVNLPGSLGGGGEDSVNPTQGTYTGLPWYFVEEASLPFRTFQTRSIFREGRERHYPDKYSVDNLTCSIYADSANEALNYLLAWNSGILRPFTASNSPTEGGRFGRPSDYKQVIRFYVLSVAKQQVAIIEYTECWPVSMEPLGMNSDEATRLVYRVNFSVGDVFVSTLDVDTSLVQQIAANPQNFPNTIQSAISNVVNAGMDQALSFARNQFSSLF